MNDYDLKSTPLSLRTILKWFGLHVGMAIRPRHKIRPLIDVLHGIKCVWLYSSVGRLAATAISGGKSVFGALLTWSMPTFVGAVWTRPEEHT